MPEPEPRRKARKMRKPGPKKGKTPPKKFAKDSNGKPKFTANEKKALDALAASRKPLPIKDLAPKIGITASAALALMNRLADRNLVKKTGEGQGKKRPKRWLYETK